MVAMKLMRRCQAAAVHDFDWRAWLCSDEPDPSMPLGEKSLIDTADPANGHRHLLHVDCHKGLRWAC
jgi:hypothetical protein